MYKIIIAVLLTLFLAACSGQNEEADAGASAPKQSTGLAFQQMPAPPQKTTVKQPRVPFKFGVGMKKYRTMCTQCHGEWAEGTDKGPPLIHPFYKPSHHADESFYRAAIRGVKAHHWKFGDMPPVSGATTDDVSRILPFIRWLQQENVIY